MPISALISNLPTVEYIFAYFVYLYTVIANCGQLTCIGVASTPSLPALRRFPIPRVQDDLAAFRDVGSLDGYTYCPCKTTLAELGGLSAASGRNSDLSRGTRADTCSQSDRAHEVESAAERGPRGAWAWVATARARARSRGGPPRA